MQWPDWAEEGAVNAPVEWSSHDISDGAAVICRNNAWYMDIFDYFVLVDELRDLARAWRGAF